MNDTDRRFIEESFPVEDVGEHAAREKNIRHGHISTLHIWWARRPLAASRATAYAALVPPPQDALEWQVKSEFIANLSAWENSLNWNLLERARTAIYEDHARRMSKELGRPVTVDDIRSGRVPPPRVLDPFAGGGSYPLEALRLGCEAYANDYNPVAVLILKATLEYPQKFGRPFEGMPDIPRTKRSLTWLDESLFEIEGDWEQAEIANPLLEAVRYWGDWVLEEARRELAQYYVADGDGDESIVGYIWARTLPCQNPACGVEIPLMRQFWLAKKTGKEIALRPLSAGPGHPVEFEIVARGKKAGSGYRPWPAGFDPAKGTVARAVVTCPACGGAIDDDTTRRLFREGKSGQRMVAVVLSRDGRGEDDEGSGKVYRLATEADLRAYRAAVKALDAKRAALRKSWGMEPVPNEPIPPISGKFNVTTYGISTWGDLFNPRQQLALLTFADAVRRAYDEMIRQGYPQDFARAVATYLGFIVDKVSDYSNVLCQWRNNLETVGHVFARQALPMLWDYVEGNCLSGKSGTFIGAKNWIVDAINDLDLKTYPKFNEQNMVTHASATRLPYPDNYFDAVLTDPPYYYSMTYADLSDFFYVWLKRTLGRLYPELFTTPLTPKTDEIIEMHFWDKRSPKDKTWFESKLQEAFAEISRVLKPNGIAVVVYAHSTNEGWEAVINALMNCGLVITGAWPIHTEMESRLVAREAAALASSIYIVARKAERQSTGFYGEVRQELRAYLDHKLERLWSEGIRGADFFIAAIGAAIEVFGKYEKVMDFEGRIIRAETLLEDVRHFATDYAVRQILKNGFAGKVSDRTRFYVLWRWSFGSARVVFDEARKLAQSCGLDLSEEWNRRGSFVRKEKEYVRVLGPHERDVETLVESGELIDVLHVCLRLWEKGDRQALVDHLARSGFGTGEAFYRVAQAISHCLPQGSKERQLIDGMLTNSESLRQDAKQARLL